MGNLIIMLIVIASDSEAICGFEDVTG